jgi:hypothetical protein
MANKSKSYHAKIEYYLGHALEIYKKHHPDDKSKQFTIYLNLIKTSMVLRNFDRALEYANQVLAIGPHLRDIPNVDNLMNGVMVNKAHILLTKIEDELQKMTVNLDTVRLLKKKQIIR